MSEGVDKVAAALLELLTTFKDYGYTRSGFEAKALYKTFDRSLIWRTEEFHHQATRKTMTKKAINLLVKRGKIICAPVYATYRRYRSGKSYKPIKHYVYKLVDNALDLLVMNIKKDEDGREKG